MPLGMPTPSQTDLLALIQFRNGKSQQDVEGLSFQSVTFSLSDCRSSLSGNLYSQSKYARITDFVIPEEYMNINVLSALLLSFINYCKVFQINKLKIATKNVQFVELFEIFFQGKLELNQINSSGSVIRQGVPPNYAKYSIENNPNSIEVSVNLID